MSPPSPSANTSLLHNFMHDSDNESTENESIPPEISHHIGSFSQAQMRPKPSQFHNTPNIARNTSTAPHNHESDSSHDDSDPSIVTMDQALLVTSSLRFTTLIIILCGTGMFNDGIELALLPFLLPILQREWALSPLFTGLLGSSVFFGMIIGAFSGGVLSDRIGRKWVFVMAPLLTTVMGFCSAFSPGFVTFWVLRMVVGIALGASIPIDYSFLMEFVHTEYRGTVLSVLNVFSGLGGTMESVLAWMILSDHPDRWRLLVFCSAFPGIIVVLCRYMLVPESPRWLVMRGEQDKAFNVLRKIAEMSNRAFPLEWLDAQGRRAVHFIGALGSKSNEQHLTVFEQVQQLFGNKYLFTTCCLLPIWFLLSCGGWGFQLLVPTLLIRVHAANPFSAIIFMSVLSGSSYIITILSVEKVPRKIFLTVGFIVCGVVLATLGLYENIYYVIFVGAVVAFFLTFPWSVLYLYTSEVFPTSIRSTGLGLCSAFTRIGGITTPIVGELLLEHGNPWPFLLYGLALLGAGTIAVFLPYETWRRELMDTVSDDPLKLSKEELYVQQGRGTYSGSDGANVSLLSQC